MNSSFVTTPPAPMINKYDKPHALIKIDDNLYRVQNGLYYSLVLVTPEGIILTDPINKEAATLLKNELHQMFNLPVKYVIYSHNHWDHVSGGEVFADTATFISHEKAKEAIVRFAVPTAIPQITFDSELALTLGKETIQLRYLGENEGVGNIIILFPQHKAVYVVDWVIFKRLPYLDMAEFNTDGVIHSLQKLLTFDFEKVLPGHGVVGTKEDIKTFLTYMQTLQQEVLKNILAGKSAAEARPSIRAILDSKYQQLGMYKEWIDMNIDGAYYQMCNRAARCRDSSL